MKKSYRVGIIGRTKRGDYGHGIDVALAKMPEINIVAVADEDDEVVNAFDMRHLQLGIAHIAQYSPVLDTVLKLVADGVIGDLLELRGRGKEDHRGGGEDLWVLGSHVFALMRRCLVDSITVILCKHRSLSSAFIHRDRAKQWREQKTSQHNKGFV